MSTHVARLLYKRKYLTMITRWKYRFELIRSQGFAFTLVQLIRKIIGKQSFRRYSINFDGTKHWLYARIYNVESGVYESDTGIYEQVFVRKEYSCIDLLVSKPNAIIDAGANVGYSAAFFRQSFPDASIVSIEPDSRNFAMLKRNIGSFKGISVVFGAIWGERCVLSMSKKTFRDGTACAQVVSELEGDVQAHTIDDIIQTYDLQKPILVKIDIEGAESNVFLHQRADTWLDKVDSVVMEVHEDSVFGNPISDIELAMERHGFSFVTSGELRMYTRVKQ
jgi:FkbM family methyltransferase